MISRNMQEAVVICQNRHLFAKISTNEKLIESTDILSKNSTQGWSHSVSYSNARIQRLAVAFPNFKQFEHGRFANIYALTKADRQTTTYWSRIQIVQHSSSHSSILKSLQANSFSMNKLKRSLIKIHKIWSWPCQKSWSKSIRLMQRISTLRLRNSTRVNNMNKEIWYE